ERLRENLAKLDLSDEQKTKIKSVLDDVKAKGEELRKQAANATEDMRDKFRDLMQETRGKVEDILTPEQQDKLREMFRAGPQPTEPNRVGPGFRRNRDRANPTTTKH